jgi:hypothetical protein
LSSPDRPERRLDRLGERVDRKAVVVGSHGLPEQAVVEMPAGVVAHLHAPVLRQGVEVGEQLFDRAVRPRGSLEGGVECGDVGAVVLVMVDAYRQRVDRRLQRAVRIRER